MKQFFIVIMVFVLTACGSEKEQVNHTDKDKKAGKIMCKLPIAVLYSEQKHLAKGYIVTVKKSVDLDQISAELLAKYPDLEIHSSFVSLNGFHANSSDKTLEKMRCEPAVKTIQYNLPQVLDPSKNKIES